MFSDNKICFFACRGEWNDIGCDILKEPDLRMLGPR